jgi:chitin disaccharide deacetylase
MATRHSIQPERRLIVNGDDFGLTEGVSRGILAAHQHGLVTSTTALMNVPGAEAALLEARRTCPSLGLGVHLVLTSGKPLLPVKEGSSLTGGTERFYRVEEFISHLADLDLAEVRAEWLAQIKRFVTITGQAPDHLDSHHHVSCFTPQLFEVTLELANQFGCPLRYPLSGEGTEDVLAGLPETRIKQVTAAVPVLLEQYHTRHPDHFISSFYDEGISSAALQNVLTNLPEGVSEVMCHPAYVDETLLATSSYATQRASELSILTDEAILSRLPEWGIKLASFASVFGKNSYQN